MIRRFIRKLIREEIKVVMHDLAKRQRVARDQWRALEDGLARKAAAQEKADRTCAENTARFAAAIDQAANTAATSGQLNADPQSEPLPQERRGTHA